MNNFTITIKISFSGGLFQNVDFTVAAKTRDDAVKVAKDSARTWGRAKAREENIKFRTVEAF